MTSSDAATKALAVDYDPFADSPEIARVVPTTEAQREVWLADGLGRDGSLAFNESISLLLSGAIDFVALQGTLDLLVGRHEALRATVGPEGLELLIAASGSLVPEIVDARALSAEEKAAELSKQRRLAVETPFNLSTGPLARAALVSTSDTEHTLILTCHHIICDGWSFGVIVREFALVYSALQEGRVPALDSADSFAEYSLWLLEQEQQMQTHTDEQYWVQQFDRGVPVLDLPTDHSRPPVRRFESEREDVLVPAALVGELRKVAARSGASLFSLLFGFFAGLMSRLSAAETVVIGVPSAGQSASGRDRLVGHCVNLLPIRMDVDLEMPAREFVSNAQRAVLDAYDHQQCTFGSLLQKLRLDRDPSRLPLVSVQFNLDSRIAPEDLAVPGLAVSLESNARTFENFEIFVNATQAPEGVVLECQYSSALFQRQTIHRWMTLYCEALTRFASEPAQSMSALFAATQDDLQLIAEQNATDAPYSLDAVVPALIDRVSQNCEIAPAIVSGTNVLTYGDLARRSNQLARALRARGVERGQLVGLCLPRTVDMVIAQLATLKAGAAYVPLDPGFPAERLAYMAEDARLSALVTTSALSNSVTWPRNRSIWLDEEQASIDSQSSDALPVDEGKDARPMDPAYIIYTSGSTGKPKGVVVHHQAVVNFLESMALRPGLEREDRLVAVTTLSFDIAVLELLLPLAVGAQVILATREDALDGNVLRGLLERNAATVMQATPATWRLLIEAGWKGSPSFKALVGGEALPIDLARELTERAGEVWNMYGPTETTVWSTCWLVDKDSVAMRIGTPIANTQIHVLDAQLRPCPIGVSGEIFIGGDGVTLGYWERPELTAEKFIADPFRKYPQAKLYRTGDRGRWCSDGLLEHLGRLDFQVKVRGFRIELGEIESKLAAHPSVAQAVVIVREDRKDDVRLVAYIVQRDTLPDTPAFKAFLRTTLPEYMLPQHFVSMDALPLTPNGKIDRKRLPPPGDAGIDESRGARIEPKTDIERRVLGAMEAVLNLKSLSMSDDFFSLGGHSLLAAKLIGQINRELDLHLGLRVLFESPTAAKLVQAIGRESGDAMTVARAPIEHRAEQGSAPLTIMQERINLVEQMQPGRVVYNAPSGHRFRGQMDVQAFDRAFREMVRRQAVLRTAIVKTQDGFIQQVDDDLECSLLPAEDLSALPLDQRELKLRERIAELVDQTFELDSAPLFKAHLFRLADDEHVLLFMPHHVIWDGWSFDIVYAEMSALYEAFSAGKPSPLPELSVTYGDFAAWHREWMKSDEIGKQIAFWRSQFARFPAPKDPYTDFPRQALATGDGGTEFLHIPSSLTAQLHDLAKRAGSTLSMVALSVYSAMMSDWLNEPAPAIGLPVRGRPQPELEAIMGFFNNMVPLRLPVSKPAPAIDWIKQVHRAVTEAFANQDVPFEMLAQDTTRLYQVMFTFQDARDRRTQWADLEHSRIPVMQRGATEDINLWLVETPDGIEGGVQYNADLFLSSTAAMLRDRFVQSLGRLVAESSRSIQSIVSVSAEEKITLAGWGEPDPWQRAADDAIAQLWSSLSATTEFSALRHRGRRWTNRELLAQVQMAATRLRTALETASNRRRIVLIADSDLFVRVVVGMAALRNDAGCLFVDSTMESQPLNDLMNGSDAAVIVADGDEMRTPMGMSHLRPQELLEGFASVTGRGASQKTAPHMPTSAIDSRIVGGIAAGLANLTGLAGGQQIVLADSSQYPTQFVQLILALIARAELVVVPAAEIESELARLPAALFCASADSLKALAAKSPSERRLGTVLLDVTESTPELAELLLNACARLVTLYRVPQLGVAISAGVVDHARDYAHFGRPLFGRVTIQGTGGEELPPGVIGELIASFDICGKQWATQIDTGSLARWRADGTLHYFGELAHVAYVEGERVDLDEIDRCLAQHPSVKRVATVSRPTPRGPLELATFVVPHDAMPDSELLIAHLLRSRPGGVTPDKFIALPSLPEQSDGSVHLRKLAAIGAGNVFGEPETEMQKLIAGIWCELLGLSRISVHDSFFDLGGHSLLAVKMLGEIERRLGVDLPLATFLHRSTCAKLAALLEGDSESSTADAWRPLVLIQQGDRGNTPVFCIHAVGGNVLYYKQLADAMPSDIPVYGLQAIGLDGLTRPLESIEEMARLYRKEIQTVQPHGPYYLCGGSMGGTIAFEMARQYEAEGESVALLGLFDTAGPNLRKQSLERPANLVEQVASYLRADGEVNFFGRVRRRLARVASDRATRKALDKQEPLPQELRWKVVEAANYRALESYREGEYRGSCTVFRALDEPTHKNFPSDLGWSAVVRGSIEVIELPGRHREFIEQPELQRAFSDVVTRAGRARSAARSAAAEKA